MIELNHSVRLVGATDAPIDRINAAARVCYDSTIPESLTDRTNFVKNLIRQGHETPLEFVSFTYEIVTDRGVSHELVRHRIASFQQQSTRYVKFSRHTDGIPVVRPFGITGAAYLNWKEAMQHAEDAYFTLIKIGCKPQLARSVLPNSLATKLFMAMNLRELRHFLKLRLSKKAHPDMQQVAYLIGTATYNFAPGVIMDTLIGDILDEEISDDPRRKSKGAREEAPEGE